MSGFETRSLPTRPDAVAPDGSDVRLLAGGLGGGGMAHFELGPGRTSVAVAHRTVEEIWLIVSGRGQMWRRQGKREEVTDLEPGLSLTIPLGTAFQFRCIGSEPLVIVATTMPPWPGEGEAIPVRGPWEPNGG